MVFENSDSTRSGTGADESRIQFEWGDFAQPSTAVAEAVATATGRDPTELAPIHESIDTDALDNLVTPVEDGNPVRISFRYEGTDVLVDSEHGIEVHLGEDI